eukprot:g4585.t1
MGGCQSLISGKVEPGDDENLSLPPKNTPKEITDKYDFEKKLGTGMSADVFLVNRKSDARALAIKCCKLKGLIPEDIEALKNEIRLLKMVKHPNILEYVDDVYTRDMVYILTELIEGGELFDAIVLRERYTEEDARVVVCTMLYILEYLHEQGIVHRDIKPENLMLVSPNDYSSPIKLVDFGLATEVGDDPHGGITQAAGTPGYLAPECLIAKPNYGKPSDVWALGVIAYVLLCGYTPFFGDTDDELFKMIREVNFEFDPAEWEIISPYAKDFIEKIFTADVYKRPTIKALMKHPWIVEHVENAQELKSAQLKIKESQAKKRFKKAVTGVLFTRRVSKINISANTSEEGSKVDKLEEERSEKQNGESSKGETS